MLEHAQGLSLHEALAAGDAQTVDISVMILYYNEFIVTFRKDVLPPSIG